MNKSILLLASLSINTVCYPQSSISTTVQEDFSLIRSALLSSILGDDQKPSDDIGKVTSFPGGITAIVIRCTDHAKYHILGVPSSSYFYNNLYINAFEIKRYNPYKESWHIGTKIDAVHWAQRAFVGDREYFVEEITQHSKPFVTSVVVRTDKPLSASLNIDSMSQQGACEERNEKRSNRYIPPSSQENTN